MAGLTNLHEILGSLRPVVRPGRFVVVSSPSVLSVPADATIAEPEGTTLVVAQQIADEHGLDYDSAYAWITLQVHTSLAAVGVTAAVATALARVGISCNVLAGFYHDHLLVPEASVDEAVDVLGGLG